MYSLIIKENLDKKFKKLLKKHKKKIEIIERKLEEIIKDPHRFKPLKGTMKGIRRVHIDSSFVLTYEINEKNKEIILLDFEHHDKIYKK